MCRNFSGLPESTQSFSKVTKAARPKATRPSRPALKIFQNDFLSILGICKWIAPIFEGWSSHYHWSYVNCQLCFHFVSNRVPWASSKNGRNGFSAARFSVPGFPFMFFLYTVFHFAVFPVAWFSLHRFYLFHQAFYHLLIRLFSIMQFGGRGNCLREIELLAWVQGFSLEL